jgi:hypothetical protein
MYCLSFTFCWLYFKLPPCPPYINVKFPATALGRRDGIYCSIRFSQPGLFMTGFLGHFLVFWTIHSPLHKELPHTIHFCSQHQQSTVLNQTIKLLTPTLTAEWVWFGNLIIFDTDYSYLQMIITVYKYSCLDLQYSVITKLTKLQTQTIKT